MPPMSLTKKAPTSPPKGKTEESSQQLRRSKRLLTKEVTSEKESKSPLKKRTKPVAKSPPQVSASSKTPVKKKTQSVTKKETQSNAGPKSPPKKRTRPERKVQPVAEIKTQVKNQKSPVKRKTQPAAKEVKESQVTSDSKTPIKKKTKSVATKKSETTVSAKSPTKKKPQSAVKKESQTAVVPRSPPKRRTQPAVKEQNENQSTVESKSTNRRSTRSVAKTVTTVDKEPEVKESTQIVDKKKATKKSDSVKKVSKRVPKDKKIDEKLETIEEKAEINEEKSEPIEKKSEPTEEKPEPTEEESESVEEKSESIEEKSESIEEKSESVEKKSEPVGKDVKVNEEKVDEELEKDSVKDMEVSEEEKTAVNDEEWEEIDQNDIEEVKDIPDKEMEVSIEETKPESNHEKKRKLDETDIELDENDEHLDESHLAKRVKKGRFEVPLIPQISGKLFTFGDEIAGEMGPREKTINGVKVKKNEPSVVNGVDKVVQVVCGAMHTVCLTSDGEVITFGCNDDAALGRQTARIDSNMDESDDSVDDSEEIVAKTPAVVVGLPKVVKVSAGDMHTVALAADGSVYVWGNFKDDSRKLGLTYDCLKKVDSDGKSMDDYNETHLPKLVDSLQSTKIVDIASGCHHILLLTENGEVLSFGEGSKGQLGRIPKESLQSVTSDRKLFLIPQKVEFEDPTVIIEKIWSSHWSSFAQSTTGDIYVWGLNNFHQLGFKTENPIEISSTDPNESQQSSKLIVELKPIKANRLPNNIKMIANGQHHMLALDTSGQVFSCGSSTYGKLGLTDAMNSEDQSLDSPRAISREAFDGQSVVHIACGEFCSFAVTESGRLYGWGQGSKHVGTEDFHDLIVPTLVNGLVTENTRFLSVSSGSQHTALVGTNLTLNGN